MEVCGKEIRFRGKLLRVARLDGEGYQFLDDPETALEPLLKFRPRPDLFTFIQRLSNPSPQHRFPMEWTNVAALPISTFDDWLSHQINKKTRNMIRKAEKKGVTLREVPFDEALIRGVHAIYNEAPIRQGRRFPHYGKDLDTVRRMTGTFPERSIFIGAFFDGELIGFAKLVIDEKCTQAGVMHLLSLHRHWDKAPTNALLAQAVRSCAERKVPNLVYGQFSHGKREGDSLADFKKHNGFQKIEVPRYYVPLTLTGRVALRLGLHHTLMEWIPAAAVVQYRKIRSLWYSRKLAGQANA